MKFAKPFAFALAGMIAVKLLLAFMSLATPANPIDFLRPVDDSYITYRYAVNLAEGKGLVYNEGERVEGGTTFALITLLAPFALIGIKRVDLVAVLLSLLSQAALVALAWRFMIDRIKRAPGLPEYFCAAFLALSLTNLVWAFSGMETTIQTLVWFAALLAHLRENENESWPIASAVLTASAGLLHPDAILIAPILALSWLFPFNAKRFSRGFVFGVLVLLIFGGYWLGRWSYFGQPFPNTFYAKVGGSGVLLLKAGWTYLRVAFFSTLVPVFFVIAATRQAQKTTKNSKTVNIILLVIGAALFVVSPNILMIVFAGILLYIATRRPGYFQTLDRWFWLYLGLVGLSSVFIIRVGGDFYPFHRFFAPLLPFLVIPFWKLCADIHDARVASSDTAATATFSKKDWAKILAVILAMNVWSYIYTFQGLIHRDLQRVVVNFAEAGLALKDALPKSAAIATLPIGAVGYFSGLPIHDMMGLVEAHIAKIPLDKARGVVGHQKYDHAYTLSVRPETIIILPSLYPNNEDGFKKWIAENALEPVQYKIYEQPALRKDYRLVSLPVGSDRALFGFLRADLAGKPGYEKWKVMDDASVAKAYNTPALAYAHPLHGKTFGIWSFK